MQLLANRMETAKHFNILTALFLLSVTVQCSFGQSTFYLTTYEANSQYLKGQKDGRVGCATGSSKALKFNLLPALSSVRDGISFRSADFERYYLVDFGGYANLESFENTRNFERSASFIVRRNHFFHGTVSYESVDYRGDFLFCHKGYLRIAKPSTEDDAARASFFTEEATTPDDLWGECSAKCGGGVQYPKRRVCLFGTFCEEQRSRPCNTHKCPSSNPCRPNPCQNEGRCQRRGASYICRCPTAYTGKHCDEITDPCGNNPCLNDGRCYSAGSNYVCVCASGYSGRDCETAIDPCKPNPCENRGSCLRNGMDYICNCRSGYTGKNCDEVINPCKPNPCENGGSCRRNGMDYVCNCKSGYTGKNCDEVINPCRPNPCENGGSCRRNGMDYVCNCRSGYTGKNCDKAVNPCRPKPCQNGGTCLSNEMDYVCNCRSGYTGTNCEHEINPCSSRPCLNGGSCRRSGDGFLCQCTAGWIGSVCQTPVSQRCSPNPCQNGGVCSETGTGYKCKCAIGYTGNRCQSKLSIGQWSSCSQPCDGGTRYRVKACDDNDVFKCPRQYGDCNERECPTADCSAPSLSLRFGTRTKCCTKSSGKCGTSSGPGSQPRIIGGVPSSPGLWPWMVAIYHKPTNTFYCGGSIVNSNWIVTAGHCAEPYPAAHLRVLIGTNGRARPAAGHAWIDISEKILHPSYDNPIDDIALIKTKDPITFTSTIKPICLPNGERLEEDTTCFAAGWGIAFVKDIPTRKPSDVLKHVGLRTLPLDACVQGYEETLYKRGVNSKIICSGLLGGGKDTCLGDSGGPLVCQRKNSCEWYLAGVTSFGPSECGIGNIPAGFMDVAQYEAWIKRNIS